MKKLRLILIVCTVAMVAVTACSKKGDAGPTGATGPAGPAGPAGPSGKDSILYSTWDALAMTPTDAGDTTFTQSIAASAVTQAVLDKGLILTYIEDNNGAVYPASDIGLYASYSVGSIDLIAFFADFSGVNFRYVVVPGTISTNGYTFAQLKKLSYADAMKALGKKATAY